MPIFSTHKEIALKTLDESKELKISDELRNELEADAIRALNDITTLEIHKTTWFSDLMQKHEQLVLFLNSNEIQEYLLSWANEKMLPKEWESLLEDHLNFENELSCSV